MATATNPEPPDDDNRSDASSDLTELDPDEFPNYFREQGGRLFHSHGHSPYPLPVDADEQHRQNRQHAMFKHFVGDNFVGPVQDVLVYEPGIQRRAVDLGTGTGKWVMDMASEFPHVTFDGLDIVPIQTRHPLPKVYFQMYDISRPLRYDDRTVDLVHARDISLTVRNYPALLEEIGRILRPGGLYVGGEWGAYPCLANNGDIRMHAPHTYAFFDVVNRALRRLGVYPIAERIPDWLEASGRFDHIEQQQFRVPVGSRHPSPTRMGQRLREIWKVYLSSMKIMLVEQGYISSDRAEQLMNGYLEETSTVRGMSFIYFTVHARRV